MPSDSPSNPQSTTENLEFQQIPPQGPLDAITVYWHDYSLGKGMVTIICWGNAWTCYFGGMGANTIREFFMQCGKDYLTNKLGCNQVLKQTKKLEQYLMRVIVAVKEANNAK